MHRALVFLFVAISTASCGVAQPAADLQTPGPQATLADTNAFADALAEASERATVVEIGTTDAGERIPAVIVASDPIEHPGEQGDAPLVVVFASDGAGAEAALALARNLAMAEEAKESLVIAVSPMPIPAEDWLALERNDQRALARFIAEWDPEVVLQAASGAEGVRWALPNGADPDLASFLTKTLEVSDADLMTGAPAVFALQGRIAAVAPAGAVEDLIDTLGSHAGAIESAIDDIRSMEVEGEEAPPTRTFVLTSDAGEAAAQLQRHAIEVGVLREDVVVDIAGAAVTLAPGLFVVSTEQDAGRLAIQLLDPAPVRTIEGDAYLLTRPARKPPEQRETGRTLTVDMLYGDEAEGANTNFRGSPARVRSWIDDERYVVSKNRTLVEVDARTGRSTIFGAETDEIEARLAESAFISVEDAENLGGLFSSPDPEDPGVLFTHADDLFFANFDGTGLRRLTSTPESEELAEFSPDGRTVAFVRDNNLFVLDLETGSERAITTEGTNERRFGKNAWVYFEEVFGRSWKAFWWSPDSEHIIFMETDESQVPVFTIIDDEPDEQVVEAIHYPKAGQTNPTVRVHIAPRAGSPVREVDLSGYTDFIVKHLGWTADGERARVQVQDRMQTWLDFTTVGVRGGKPKTLFRETTGAWVDSPEDGWDLDDGSFLLFSERDGWKHLYRFDESGELRSQVTSGEWEVREVHHVDEELSDEEGWIYFTGTADSHIAEHLYRIRLDGSGMERLTSERGHHSVELSPDATMFVDSWSNAQQPTRVALRTIEGDLIRWIDTNPVYELEEFDLSPVELVQIESEKGPALEGSLLFPPDFDETKQYPVWFQTYAGPHAPTVRDAWSGSARDHLLTHMGIVVFRADPYPASGKGAQSAWTAYKQLGVRELEDIEELIAWVTGHPWADAERVGMQGHSYGGFMTSYAMTHSDLFAAGIAGAPVTDWHLYDTIYTERYMQTPQENPEGYEKTSVVNSAADMHGRMLLAHGTMDDNVHMENAIDLIGALHEAEVPFDLMVYPGSRHGIRSGHYGPMQIEFIERWLLQE